MESDFYFYLNFQKSRNNGHSLIYTRKIRVKLEKSFLRKNIVVFT